MTALLVYSGYRRTWKECKQNHIDTLGPHDAVHYDSDLEYYTDDDFGYNANKAGETWVPHTLNQWHNMWQAWCIAKPGYDVYVRMRHDIIISEPIRLDSFEYNDNRVFIPSGNDYREGINDQMAFGTYAAMRKYYNVYLTHKMLFAAGRLFHPESYLKWSMEHLGVEIVRITQTNVIKRLQ